MKTSFQSVLNEFVSSVNRLLDLNGKDDREVFLNCLDVLVLCLSLENKINLLDSEKAAYIYLDAVETFLSDDEIEAHMEKLELHINQSLNKAG